MKNLRENSPLGAADLEPGLLGNGGRVARAVAGTVVAGVVSLARGSHGRQEQRDSFQIIFFVEVRARVQRDWTAVARGKNDVISQKKNHTEKRKRQRVGLNMQRTCVHAR